MPFSRIVFAIGCGLTLFSFTTGNVLAQAAEVKLAHRKKVNELRQLHTELRAAKDEAERTGIKAELGQVAEDLFDLEVKMTEQKIAEMQKDLKRRKANREQLINERVVRFTDPNAPIGRPVAARRLGAPQSDKAFQITSINQRPDGSSVANVIAYQSEKRVRSVNYTVNVPKTRTRVGADGKEEAYTVIKPEQRTRQEPYTVRVAKPQQIVIPKGKKPEEVVRQFLKLDNPDLDK